MSDLICVFDVGTTGTRTEIFNIEGRVIAKAYEEYPISKQPVGISEQDPMIWWNAIKNTCTQAVKKVKKKDIIGISASFLRSTTTIIDKEGNVLHPALTWMDEREETTAKDWDTDADLRRIIPKINWIKKNKPELFNKAVKIINPDSFIYMKLCGACVTDPSNGIWGILNKNTLECDEKLADLYDLPIDLWPEVHTSGKVIGELSSESARVLNLKNNIPIILGGGDQQCSALGLGVIHKGQVKVTTGTGTFVDYVVDKPVEIAGDFPIFSLPSVIKGIWNIEGSIPGTGTAFKWFKDNFSQMQIKESQEKHVNIYDNLTEEARSVPPGSEGLLFIPLYMFRKGTIHGLSWNHGRAHMIRAIMESAALSAQMYSNLLEGVAKSKPTEIRVDGGAMNCDLWTQIFADVMSNTILVSEVKDGAALGAAILGFYGCESYNSFESAIDSMVRFSDKKEPIKENSKIYKKLNRIFMPTLLSIYTNKRVTKDL
jgi:sugar (pentulose or hexulose) kinase